MLSEPLQAPRTLRFCPLRDGVGAETRAVSLANVLRVLTKTLQAREAHTGSRPPLRTLAAASVARASSVW